MKSAVNILRFELYNIYNIFNLQVVLQRFAIGDRSEIKRRKLRGEMFGDYSPFCKSHITRGLKRIRLRAV